MPKLYLLDIEGTTSPISFVYDVLFPYARKHMAEYLAQHASSVALQPDLQLLAEENLRDRPSGAPVFSEGAEAATAYLLWLMDKDRKSTALKSIQGKIWGQGFDRGELYGEVYSDVPVAFERWYRQRCTPGAPERRGQVAEAVGAEPVVLLGGGPAFL